MGLLNQLKVMALVHALNNMDVEKIVDLLEDYQRKEFGDKADRALGVTGDKLIRIGLSLYRRRK